MKLKYAIAKITIGQRFVVQTGDGFLQSVDVAIAEQDRSSSCQISIYDPGLKILNLLLTNFQTKGGIYVPKGLLSEEQQAPISGAISPTQTPTGTLLNDDLAKAIIAECNNQGVTMPEQQAYVCATAQHESSGGRILVEQGSKEYFDYLENRPELGNTEPGSGFRYRGRGYIQLTGKINYERWSKKLGLDLVSNPEPAADPRYAIPILVITMRDGLATGKKLNDYIRPGSVDFFNARRIVNALDKAELIAGYARTWLAKLPSLGGTTAPTNNNSGTASSIPSASGIIGGLKNPADTIKKELEIDISQGIVIDIELGFNDGESNIFRYLLTEVKGSNDSPNSTKIAGRQVRYAIAKGSKQFKVYRNTSIKQLAKEIAGSIGADVQIENTPASKTVLPVIRQTENNYQFLLKLAKQANLFVRGDVKALKLETLKSNAKKIVISKKVLLPGSNWGESASSDRVLVGDNAKTKTAATTKTTTTTTTTTTNTTTSNQIPSASGIIGTLNENANTTVLEGVLEVTEKLDEKKGIAKGFEGSLNINSILLSEVLQIQPGDIASLDNSIGYGNAIARDYRISEVRHSHSSSGLQTSLNIYLPVAIKVSGQVQSATNPTNTAVTPQEPKKAEIQPTNDTSLHSQELDVPDIAARSSVTVRSNLTKVIRVEYKIPPNYERALLNSSIAGNAITVSSTIAISGLKIVAIGNK